MLFLFFSIFKTQTNKLILMSVGIKALFFVSKPLELLGAIEAKKQFNITEATLIYSCRPGLDRDAIEFLIKKSPDWVETTFIKHKPYYGKFWVALIKRLQQTKYDYLFTRAFAESAYFVHNLKYSEHILLDDGMATINISEEFKNEKNLTKRFSLFRGIDKKGFKYNLISKLYSLSGIITEKPVDKIGFFSFYDLPEIINQKVYKNKKEWLNNLKTEGNITPIDDTIYIVGTNVVGASILRSEDYFSTIKKIKTNLNTDKQLVYIPHPNESDSFLAKLEDVGISIQIKKYNIELDFLLNNLQPTHIVGTISTALITLKLIYSDALKVDYFTFESEALSEENKNTLQHIYKYQDKYLNKIELNY